MARKTMTRKQKTTRRKAATPLVVPAERVPRGQVITYRISDAEAALIRQAADRVPLARYSRDAVLARAQADSKK